MPMILKFVIAIVKTWTFGYFRALGMLGGVKRGKRSLLNFSFVIAGNITQVDRVGRLHLNFIFL